MSVICNPNPNPTPIDLNSTHIFRHLTENFDPDLRLKPAQPSGGSAYTTVAQFFLTILAITIVNLPTLAVT